MCIHSASFHPKADIHTNVIRIHLVSSPLQPYSRPRDLVPTPSNEATSDCVISGMLSKACHFTSCAAKTSAAVWLQLAAVVQGVPSFLQRTILEVKCEFDSGAWDGGSMKFPMETVDSDGESRNHDRHGAPQTRAATDRSLKVTNSNLKGCLFSAREMTRHFGGLRSIRWLVDQCSPQLSFNFFREAQTTA